jgi:hypothetical protein
MGTKKILFNCEITQSEMKVFENTKKSLSFLILEDDGFKSCVCCISKEDAKLLIDKLNIFING